MTGQLNVFLFTSIGLFCLGAFGVLVRRNALLILMSVELMLNGVNMAFITFARGFGGAPAPGGVFEMGQAMQGHVFALMVMAVAAAEAAIGIAIVVSIFRARGRVLVDEARELKG
jgi:NADH-quinone oxidoreductase subunit K